MGVCTDQAIKIRNLIKAPSMSPADGCTGRGEDRPMSSNRTREAEELRATREHASLVEQHAEILRLSLRLDHETEMGNANDTCPVVAISR